jgi:tetratricopeptide (TPR) repeat protein
LDSDNQSYTKREDNAMGKFSFNFREKIINNKILLVIIMLIIASSVLLGGIFSVQAINGSRINHQISLGNKYILEGKHHEAILEFTKVIQRDVKNVAARIGIGKAYLLLKDYGKAKDTFNTAIDVNPNNRQIYIDIEKLYIDADRLDDAVEIIKAEVNNIGDEEVKKKFEEIKSKLGVEKIELTIKQGDKLALPDSVEIKYNGEYSLFPIKWESPNVDTNRVGEYSINGTNTEHERKVNLILKVYPYIKLIEDLVINVNQGEGYSLPSTVKAKMSSGNDSEVEITWNSKQIDTTKPGKYTLEGNVKDYPNNIRLSLTVIEEVKQLGDDDIKKLVVNAHKSFSTILNCVYGEQVDGYAKFPKEYNSYNKLFSYLNKSWTADASNKLIKFIGAENRNGVYSMIIGEIGEGSFDIDSAIIVSKNFSDKKGTVVFRGKLGDGEIKNFRAELIYVNKSWLVSYWQWAFGIFGE